MATRKSMKSPSAATRTRKTAIAEVNNGGSHSEVSNGVAIANGKPGFAEIQLRAYELFLSRGGTHGDDLADWYAAEKDLMVSPRH